MLHDWSHAQNRVASKCISCQLEATLIFGIDRIMLDYDTLELVLTIICKALFVVN